jgi:hypothetical protein
MFTFENNVGRLIEMRMATPVTICEVEAFITTVRQVFAKRPGRFVCCSDFRRMNVLAPDVAESLLEVMKQSNTRIERNAFWVSEGATWSLQAERMVREAGNPGRRTFRTRAELESWVSDLLDPPERARLAAFLSEGSNP